MKRQSFAGTSAVVTACLLLLLQCTYFVELAEAAKAACGANSIELKNALTEEVLLSYSNDSIINWRPEATFSRPKWGVYRSLIYPDDIRDEAVLFSDFSILEQ